MNIDELDRIEAQERHQEIKQQLDQLDNSDNDFSDIDHCLDIDLSYSDGDGEDSTTPAAVDMSGHQGSVLEELNASYADEQELDELKQYKWKDESDTVLNLVRSLTERNADYRALELRYNHVKLQNESLVQQERALRETVSRLEFENAIAEENLILLEDKLRTISSFEGGGNESSAGDDIEISLNALRGRLLTASTGRIRELEDEILRVRGEAERRAHQTEDDLMRLQSECVGLREEADSLTLQLAQRTVLYSAQERRFHNEHRMWSGNQEAQADEIIRLRARLQQMEVQCAQLDRERIAAVLECRELRVSHEEITRNSAAESTRLAESEQELLAAMELNQSLQETVSRLRGADVEDIEREMAQEVEAIRHQAQQREEELRLQLEDAREMLRGDGGRLGDLAEENAHLRGRVAEMGELLREIKDHSGFGLSMSPPTRAAANMSTSRQNRIVGDNCDNEYSETEIVVQSQDSNNDRDESLDLILGGTGSDSSGDSAAVVESGQASSDPLHSSPTQPADLSQLLPTPPPPLTPGDAVARAVLLSDLLKVVLYSTADPSVQTEAPSTPSRCGIRRGVVRFVLGLKAPRVPLSESSGFDSLSDYDDFSLTAQEEGCVGRFIQAVESLLEDVPEAMLKCSRDESSERSWVMLRNKLVATYLAAEETCVDEDTFEPRRLESFLTGHHAQGTPSWAEWDKLQREIKGLREALISKDSLIPSLQEEITTLRDDLEQSMLESTNMSMSIVDHDREQWVTQMKVLDDRSRDLEQNSLQVLVKLRAIEAEKKELENQIELADREHANQLAAAEIDRERLAERLRTFQAAIQSSADRMQSLEDERSRLQGEMALLRSQCNEESDTVGVLREQLATLEGSYIMEREELESKVSTLEAKLAARAAVLDDISGNPHEGRPVCDDGLMRDICRNMDRGYTEHIAPLMFDSLSASSLLNQTNEIFSAKPYDSNSSDEKQCAQYLDSCGASLIDAVACLCRSLDARTTEKDKLSAQIDNWRDELDNYQVQVEVLEQERKSLMNSMKTMNMSSGDFSLRTKHSENEKRSKKCTLVTSMIIENFETEIEDIDENICTLEKEIRLVNARTNDLRKESASATQEADRMATTSHLAELETKMSSYEKQLKLLSQNRCDLLDKLGSLRVGLGRSGSDMPSVGIDAPAESEQNVEAAGANPKSSPRASSHPCDASSDTISVCRTEDTQAMLEKVNSELYTLRQQHEDLLNVFASSETEKKELENQIELADREHANQLAAAEIDRERLAERLRTFQAAIQSSADRMQSLEDERSRLQGEMALLRSQCNEESDTVGVLREQLATLEGSYIMEREELESKVSTLEAKLAATSVHPAEVEVGNFDVDEVLLVVRAVNVLLEEAGVSEETAMDDGSEDVDKIFPAMGLIKMRVELLLQEKIVIQDQINKANALARTNEVQCQALKEQLEEAMSKHDELVECIRDIDEDRDAILSKVDKDKRNAEKAAKAQAEALQNELDVMSEKYLTEKCRLAALSDELEQLRVRGGAEAQIKTLQSQRDSLMADIDRLTVDSTRRTKAAEDKNVHLSEQISALQQKQLALEAKNDVLDTELAAAIRDRSEMLFDFEKKLETGELRIGELEGHVQELNQEKNVLVDELKNVHRLKATVEREREDSAKKLRSLESKILELHDHIRQVEEEREVVVDELRSKYADTVAVSAVQREKDMVAAELSTAKAFAEEQKEQIQVLEREGRELRETVSLLKEDGERLKVTSISEKRLLEEQLTCLERRITSSSTQIKALEEERMALTRQLRGTWARQVESNDDLAGHIDSLKKEYNILARRVEIETSARQEADERNAALLLEMESKDALVHDASSRIEADIANNAEKDAAYAAAVTALEKAQVEIAQLKEQLGKQITSDGVIRDERADWEGERQDMLKREESLTSENAHLRAQLEVVTAVANNAEKDAAYAAAVTALEKAQVEIAQLKEQLGKQITSDGVIRDERADWEGERQDMLKREESLTSENAHLRAQLEVVSAHWREEMTEAVQHVKLRAAEESIRTKTRLEAAHALEIQVLEQRLQKSSVGELTMDSQQLDVQRLGTALMERENMITDLQNQLLSKQSAYARLEEESKEREEKLKSELKNRFEMEFESRKIMLGETSQKALNHRVSELSRNFEKEKERLVAQISEKNQTIAELSADMRGYGQRLQDKWKEARRNLKEKYNHRLEDAKRRYADEVHTLVKLVKEECSDIFAEVQKSSAPSREVKYDGLRSDKFPLPPHASPANHEMSFNEHLLRSQTSAAMPWGGSRLSDSINSRRTGISGLVVAPEMLSPEETQELVRSILSRSTVASISVHPVESSNPVESDTWGQSSLSGRIRDGSGRVEFVRDSRHHSIPHHTSSSSRSVLGASAPESTTHGTDDGRAAWTEDVGEPLRGMKPALAPPSASYSPSFHATRGGRNGGAPDSRDAGKPHSPQSASKTSREYSGDSADRSDDPVYEERVSRRMERMIAKLETIRK